MPPRPDSEDHHILRTWCSQRDLAQLVRRCIDARGLGFATFYAVSNNTRRVWDITNARDLLGRPPPGNLCLAPLGIVLHGEGQLLELHDTLLGGGAAAP